MMCLCCKAPTLTAAFVVLLTIMVTYIGFTMEFSAIRIYRPKAGGMRKQAYPSYNSVVRRVGFGGSGGNATTSVNSTSVTRGSSSNSNHMRAGTALEDDVNTTLGRGDNSAEAQHRIAITAPKVNPAPAKLKCPTPDKIPRNKARVSPRKGQTTLEKVGHEILGLRLQKARDLATMANMTLPSIRAKRRMVGDTARTIDETISEMDMSVDLDDYRLLPGGHWTPISCNPRWKVAVIVPFRNRFQHLPIFLRHIVPLLKKQMLEFSIFISEQRNDLRFNRAMLMNVGFVEALNFTRYDCVVFHDVDHIALNVNNYFGCDSMPRHFISGEAMWGYKLMYESLFGGVSGLTTAQFRTINGLSNVYWGWGGEDDDFAGRIHAQGLKRTRPEGEIGYFDTVSHESKVSSRNNARFCLLNLFRERMEADGLSNLAYEPPVIELHPLYTNVSVNIRRLPWESRWHRCRER